MPLMEKQRRHNWDTRRPKFAVYRRRRRIGLSVLVLLAVLALGGLGTYLSAGSSEEEMGDGPSEQVAAPAEEEQAPEEEAAEKEAAEDEEAERAVAAPADPTLYLTVPRLGVYSHTVRNDRSEAALDLGAIKQPGTGFPWQSGDKNTYIACHRIGWPGTESYHQCLNLPSMQKGDEVFLTDTNGTVYRYQVSEVFAVEPYNRWVMDPIAGRDVVSLQTCTETVSDWWTIGPRLFDGDKSGRLVVRADRVG